MDENALDPRTFWHFVGPPGLTLINGRVWKGVVPTPSAMSRMPGTEWMQSTHDIAPMLGGDAEQLLEKIRQQEFPEAASRRGAMFLFDDRQTAEVSAQDWLRGAPFEIIRVRVILGSKVHRGSLGWLDEPAERWDDAFRAYWRGEMSPRPPGHWEYAVNGHAYFPDWQRPPFGLPLMPR